MSNPKEIYILISYPRENAQNNDIIFKNKKILIQNIYSEKNEKVKNGNLIVLKYFFQKLKKEEIKANKKEKTTTIDFTSNKKSYKIEFELGNRTFIFEPKINNIDEFHRTEKKYLKMNCRIQKR